MPQLNLLMKLEDEVTPQLTNVGMSVREVTATFHQMRTSMLAMGSTMVGVGALLRNIDSPTAQFASNALLVAGSITSTTVALTKLIPQLYAASVAQGVLNGVMLLNPYVALAALIAIVGGAVAGLISNQKASTQAAKEEWKQLGEVETKRWKEREALEAETLAYRLKIAEQTRSIQAYYEELKAMAAVSGAKSLMSGAGAVPAGLTGQVFGGSEWSDYAKRVKETQRRLEEDLKTEAATASAEQRRAQDVGWGTGQGKDVKLQPIVIINNIDGQQLDNSLGRRLQENSRLEP